MPLSIISSQLPHHTEKQRCLINAVVFKLKHSLLLKLENDVRCFVLVLLHSMYEVGTFAPVDSVPQKFCYSAIIVSHCSIQVVA